MYKNFHTDLAVEAHELSRSEGKQIDGVTVQNKDYGNIRLRSLEIQNKNGSDALNKAIGRYVTIEYKDLKYNTDNTEELCFIISREIRKMCRISNKTHTLVVGLGNRSVTPDALGSEVIEQILVTKHLKSTLKNELTENMSSVCAIAPGVLGTTGMESSEIIKSISDKLKPELIIVIDALAAANPGHLASTVQISNAGIQPGAGVGNKRKGINRETLGVDVIAIGIPTVIDARNVTASDISKNMPPLMVTTTDIDSVIKQCAKILSIAINSALHKDIKTKKIMELIP